jgi:hypothetical protein
MWFELEPAYGRDYKTKKEVTDAFLAGKDFSGDYQLGFKPVNIQDIPKPCTVQLRYARKEKFAVLKVSAGTARQNPGGRDPFGGRKATLAGAEKWIHAGDRVTVADRFGKLRTGRAVMLGPAGWVLNMGGRHGTPLVATPDSIVEVRHTGR